MPTPPIHPTTAYQPPSPRTKLQNYLKQKGAALEKASAPAPLLDGAYRSSPAPGALNPMFLPPSGTPSPHPAVTPLQIHSANPAVRLSSPKRDMSLDLPPRTTGPEEAIPGQGRDPAAHFLNSQAQSGAPPHLHGAGRTDTQASTELRACLNTMRASFMELSDTVTRAQNTKGSPKRTSGGRSESGTRQEAAEGEDQDPEAKWLIRTRTPPPRAARDRIEPGSPVVGGGMPHRVREMEAPHQGARDPATCPKCKSFLAMPPPGSIRTACTHCGAKYNAVSCPNCKIANFWQQGEFVQGADSQCLACKVNFAMVLCPGVGCGTPYYAERFLQGVPTECPRCNFDFAMISCPQCHCSNFWKATEYKQGARTECSECHHAFAMVNCNGCGVATFWNKPVANTHSVLCKSCKKMAPSVGA